MAETAKILAPEKKVLLPDINAGCSLADSCKAEDFKKFIDENPGRTVVTYVNTTAEIKALSDISCTSSNAVQIIKSLPENEKFTYILDGNAIQLDYILASTDANWQSTLEIIHRNSIYDHTLQVTDHDPVVAEFMVP